MCHTIYQLIKIRQIKQFYLKKYMVYHNYGCLK
jgi:hypothetical protein